MTLELVLPVPPTRHHGHGPLPRKDFLTYKQQVRLRAVGVKPMFGALCVVVRWFRHYQRGDLHARILTCLEALEGIAWSNSQQVAELHAYRFQDGPRPRMEVTVSPQQNAASLEALYVKPLMELEG